VLVRGDFTRGDEVARTVNAAAGALGGLDILVNNAGSLLQRVALADLADAQWEAVIALNLSSVFYACRAALPHLRDGARVVNVASIAAHTGGGPHSFPYAAAKGGVISLTRGLARELAPRGVRVNAISPGTVLTPFHERFSTPERLEGIRQGIPLGRLGVPEECAGAVLFLCSALSAYITGEVVEINGGQHFA
jgi:3-oxoacyl-[acyl-carrier protein] reductase